MFLYSPTCSTDIRLYDFLSKELCKTGFQIKDIKAKSNVADLFAREYSKQTGRDNITNMNMYILLLTKLKPIRLLDLEIKKVAFENSYILTQPDVHQHGI